MTHTPPRPSLLVALALALAAPGPTAAASGYTESVTFSFDEGKVSYGKSIGTAFLLLDEDGGLNPLWKAQRMTRSGSTWSITVQLAEGDYIYVFVADADKYVNLSDCNLNEDDVPDANFFNDPAPRFSGMGGQYGKDNVYLVRDPLRPQYTASTVTPAPGTLFTSGPIQISVQARAGAGSGAKPVQVRQHVNEPPGSSAAPAPPWPTRSRPSRPAT